MSAALPWARSDAASEEASQAAPELRSPVHHPELSEGERLQVRWQLTDDESGAVATKWWGATVESRPSDAVQDRTWRIRYDAEEGFEAEQADVRFLSAAYLRHKDDAAMLRWRRETDHVDEESEEEDEDVIEIRDITAAYEDLEREMGQTMDQAAMQELQTLDPFQQRFIVSGFRQYMDTITDSLKALVERQDDNYVVTEADVKTILSGVKRPSSGA